MNCPVCQTQMKALFTSTYCPNDFCGQVHAAMKQLGYPPPAWILLAEETSKAGYQQEIQGWIKSDVKITNCTHNLDDLPKSDLEIKSCIIYVTVSI